MIPPTNFQADCADCVTPVGAVPGPAGATGNQGTAGTNGLNALSVLLAGFTVPAANANVIISADTRWMVDGQTIFIEFAGYYEVITILGNSSVTVENLGYSTNTVVGTAIPANARIAPSGPVGPSGATTGVTSVGLTVPSGLSVTPGSITTNGTFVVTWATGQTANRFLATPDGVAGAVSLRALVAGDLPASVTLLGNVFNIAGKLVQLDGVGAYPAAGGAAITGLNASNLATGTVADARLSANVVKANALPAAIRQLATIQAASPVTGATVTFGTQVTDIDLFLTPVGTLATLSIAFPADANSYVGQVLSVFSTQIVTALTVSVSGGTIYGSAATALAAGGVLAYKKLAANVWFRLV